MGLKVNNKLVFEYRNKRTYNYRHIFTPQELSLHVLVNDKKTRAKVRFSTEKARRKASRRDDAHYDHHVYSYRRVKL